MLRPCEASDPVTPHARLHPPRRVPAPRTPPSNSAFPILRRTQFSARHTLRRCASQRSNLCLPGNCKNAIPTMIAKSPCPGSTNNPTPTTTRHAPTTFRSTHTAHFAAGRRSSHGGDNARGDAKKSVGSDATTHGNATADPTASAADSTTTDTAIVRCASSHDVIASSTGQVTRPGAARRPAPSRA
jgi:hypothetical protein